MAHSFRKKRRLEYSKFSDGDFRKAVYSLCKSIQAQGMTIPQSAQDFVDHCDKVKRDIPKPKKE